MFNLKLVIITLVLIVIVARATIRPGTTLSVINGEGFLTYLDVAKNFGTIENCWFKFRDGDRILLELNASDPITTERGEVLLPFSSSVCGIRVNKVNSASDGIWTLEAENANGESENGSLTINILPIQKTRFETHVELPIGKGTITCTQHDSYTKHCKIVGENGKSWDECSVYTDIRPNSTFECLAFNWGRMEESHETIIVDIQATKALTTATIMESDSSVILQCEFQGTVSSCQAEMPDHKKEIYIMEGLYNGRYSAYNTSKSNAICALEIPKPLGADEIGLWRIKNYASTPPSGCIFYVGKPKKDIIDEELELLQNAQVIQVKQTGSEESKISEISCTVPFVIQDCYIWDSNKTLYFPDEQRFARERLYGKCSFTNLVASSGNWICGVRGHDFEREVLQDVEVIVKPEQGEVITPQLKARRGNNVELMCKTPFDEPITHCAFTDPQDQVHLLATRNNVKTVGHVQYFGRGIYFGDCGAKITDLVSTDFGEWQCQFIPASGILKPKFAMELSESAVAHATSVGLGVGITVVILLVLGVIIGTVFYRRRNARARHTFPSENPLHDNISLPSRAPSGDAPQMTTPT